MLIQVVPNIYLTLLCSEIFTESNSKIGNHLNLLLSFHSKSISFVPKFFPYFYLYRAAGKIQRLTIDHLSWFTDLLGSNVPLFRFKLICLLGFRNSCYLTYLQNVNFLFHLIVYSSLYQTALLIIFQINFPHLSQTIKRNSLKSNRNPYNTLKFVQKLHHFHLLIIYLK